MDPGLQAIMDQGRVATPALRVHMRALVEQLHPLPRAPTQTGEHQHRHAIRVSLIQ